MSSAGQLVFVDSGRKLSSCLPDVLFVTVAALNLIDNVGLLQEINFILRLREFTAQGICWFVGNSYVILPKSSRCHLGYIPYVRKDHFFITWLRRGGCSILFVEASSDEVLGVAVILEHLEEMLLLGFFGCCGVAMCFNSSE